MWKITAPLWFITTLSSHSIQLKPNNTVIFFGSLVQFTKCMPFYYDDYYDDEENEMHRKSKMIREKKRRNKKKKINEKQ